nr:hypothetical protein Iba_chr15eCG7960 [Ipomoea batatas]
MVWRNGLVVRASAPDRLIVRASAPDRLVVRASAPERSVVGSGVPDGLVFGWTWCARCCALRSRRRQSATANSPLDLRSALLRISNIRRRWGLAIRQRSTTMIVERQMVVLAGGSASR